MMTILYDAEYTGARYTYGCRYRPVYCYSVPDGWIIGSVRGHPDFRHGTVDYPRELTEDEVARFELTSLAPFSTVSS